MSTIDVPTQAPTTDPVVAQVVRSRLVAITDQMRLALQSVSGSPTVTEASDFFTGLYLPDGSFATMGHQVTFEAPPVGALIRHLLAGGRRLRDGDRIVGNDPFVGALHQNDLQMCAPLFVDGELVAWAGVMAHETDIGGMDFASWSPKAKEIWQEGLRIPAVTLVSEGELREDVLEMILSASRLPAQLGLDIRAFIATLNVAAERLVELCHRYGTDVVQGAMAAMVDDAETRLRRRLLEMPDGVVHTRDFLEHDGHTDALYAVDLVLTKQGDRLTLDFSGSSGQAPGFVNCSRAGLAGGVAGALIPTLGFEIPWNDGLLRPVEIVAPDGLVCTAVPPAPVGSATVETVWVVSNVVSGALNRLLAATPAYAHRAQAVSSGTMATFNLSGRNQFGEVFGLHLMDPLAGGFGAFASRDGQDAAGPINAPCPSIADVEVNELGTPLVYLYRRLAQDTGGAGRHRGGMGAEVALTISVPEAEALVMTHGAEVPNSAGLSGGLPGGLIHQSFARAIMRDATESARTAALLRGRTDTDPRFTNLGPKPGAFPITGQDVFAVTWQGGGGIGDPLDRDPAAVLADVRRGVVSTQAARETYGVALTPSGSARATGWDAAETARLRRQARAQRLGVATDRVPETCRSLDPALPPAGLRAGERWLPLSDRLRAIRGTDGTWRVGTVDGALLVTGSTRWRRGAHRVALALPERAGATLHEDLAVTGWACPVTGHLLAVDVHPAGTDPIDDLDLSLDDRAARLTLPA
ncbi:hydantoinase B/oxoprolinase family protein [Georgenia thermotolerans]|uniref:Hydantoinase B/oxoprolinase family protein n=1 Tax=Georgenia thermotolerans TaxID=527326 RepID=A0A7J5UTY7_9MICO|nr:hydantoinase B/oxoprolinase family protein [Georgenia thermotolerans]KAE8765743.1 hydantoinase B/oxoprolinase family protein [Georgenia thermotolerans]